jgi:hypothetical protein
VGQLRVTFVLYKLLLLCLLTTTLSCFGRPFVCVLRVQSLMTCSW